MKIRKIEIDNFGKFHKYSLDLYQGTNLIYGDNEDGKTTLMEFIKMMFYSEQKRSRDIANNPRKKYMPWNGLPMGGAIEFESEGIIYRIEKEMGATPAKDKVKVINIETGKLLLNKKEEIGKTFLRTDLAGFERSIFIGQIGSFGPDKEDEIAQKLSNMFSTGEESISQNQVQERLGKAKEEMKTIRGNKGLLMVAKESLERLKETKDQIKELEESQGELIKDYRKKKELILEKKDQKKKLEKWAKVQELQRIQEKLQVLIEKAEEEKRLSDFIGEGKIPIEELDSYLFQCQTLQRNIEDQEVAMKHFAQNSHLQTDPSKEIKEEEYRKFEKIQEELYDIEQCQAYFQKNLIPVINDFNHTKEQMIQQKNAQRERKDKKVFLGGIVGSILLIILNFIIHPLGLIAGIVSGVINLLLYQKRKKKQDSDLLAEDPMIRKMEKSLKHQILYFKEQFLTDYRLNMDARQYLESLLQKREHIETKIKWILREKHCETKNDFQVLYLDNVSNQKNQKTLEAMEKEYQECCEKFLQKVSRYKEVYAIGMAQEQLENLEKLLIKQKEKKQELQYIANALDVKHIRLEELSKENNKISEQISQQGNFIQVDIEEFSHTEARVQQLEEEICKLEEILPRQREQIRIPEKNLSQIEVEQKQLEEKIVELQTYYDSLEMAETVMKEAGEEIRQSFGPELNQKTGEIFQQLTGGRYKQVLVAKDYSMLTQPTEDIHYRETSYLSNGTIDQAYLALRLAITQLITKENKNLPLFLDDVFMQYDDKRAKEGFIFLNSYSEEGEKQSQIIILTCHNRIADLAKEQLKGKVNIIRL